MANKIQFKRGLKANLPVLSIAEPALCTDTEQIFIGAASGNVELAKKQEIKKLAYQEKQTLLYGKFYQMLRQRSNVKIACMGDSLTYGHDTTSTDKRPPKSDPLCDPSVTTHVQTQASKTYPEALQEKLNLVYGTGIVTVVNRGFSGDGTREAYNRWTTNVSSNLTLIELGTNDSRASWIDYAGNIGTYLDWYRKLIERELDRNSAVIILTPFKLLGEDLRVDEFSNALYLLGGEYGIPVITGDELMANYGADCYSDDTHFNGKGYNILGSKIASFFIGEGVMNVKHVGDGTELLTRRYLDNCEFTNGTSNNSSAGYPTPDEIITGQGIGYTLGSGNQLIYSVYCETENLVVLPSIFFGTSSTWDVKVEVDFGVEMAEPSNDYSAYNLVSNFNNPVSSVVYTQDMRLAYDINTSGDNNHTLVTKQDFLYSDKLPKIVITTKGWHTIRLTPNSVAGASIHGLSFVRYDDIVINNMLNSLGYMYYSTHANYTDTNSVASSVIRVKDIMDKLKIDPFGGGLYWRMTPLKITIHNWDYSIIEYFLAPYSSWRLSSPNRISLQADTTKDRTITSITYNSSTDEITINWGGALTRATAFFITKA